MKYRVEHRTHYLYGETVSLCHNLAHIIPLNSARQHCLERAIDIAPYNLSAHLFLAELEDRVSRPR